MAEEHNALKYGGPLLAAAAKATGGGYADVGVSRLSETLTPVIDMWDRNRPENALLRGERPWIINPSQNGVAGETAIVGVSNPAGSGLLVIVEELLLSDGTAREVQVRGGANFTFDATANPLARDTRIPGFPNARIATVSFAHSDPALQGSLIYTFRRLANDSQWMRVDVVLAPGFFLGLSTAVATAINASFIGYERLSFPGERG